MRIIKKDWALGFMVSGLFIIFLIILNAGCREGEIATEQNNYGLGTTITVDTTEDSLTVNGNCAWREACKAAATNTAQDGCPAGTNSNSNNDVIVWPSGTYTAALTGAENSNAGGDCDVPQSLKIAGDAMSWPTLDMNNLDRAFHITGTGVNFELENMHITNGCTNAAQNSDCKTDATGSIAVGAGFYFNSSGTLYAHDFSVSDSEANGGGAIGICAPSITSAIIEDFSFTGNTAKGAKGGGAMLVHVPTTIQDGECADNTANQGSGFGGCLRTYSDSGHVVVTVNRVDFSGNDVVGSGGAIAATGTGNSGNSSEVQVFDSTFDGDTATVLGGEIYAQGGSGGTDVGTNMWCGNSGCKVVVDDSTIQNGVANKLGGGVVGNPTGTAQGVVELRGTTSVSMNSDTTMSPAYAPDCYGNLTLKDFSSVGNTTGCTITDLRTCGNSMVDMGEDCDGTECCSATCTFLSSGTGCDDEDECTGDDECDGAGTCEGSLPECGNGDVELCEACDDDNTTSHDGCSSTCEVEACIAWE